MWLWEMSSEQETLFRALADPTRRAIFERLCRDGAQSVGALTTEAGVSQPAVTKHLGLLKAAGLVSFRHDGRRTIYSAQADALSPLADWTRQMTTYWNARLNDLESLLNRMDQ
jgi:DNA-binding transcriptional ArsR family regulator